MALFRNPKRRIGAQEVPSMSEFHAHGVDHRITLDNWLACLFAARRLRLTSSTLPS